MHGSKLPEIVIFVSSAVDRWSQFRDGLKTVDVAKLFARHAAAATAAPQDGERQIVCVCVFSVFRVVTALMGLVGAVPKEHEQFQHEMHPY